MTLGAANVSYNTTRSSAYTRAREEATALLILADGDLPWLSEATLDLPGYQDDAAPKHLGQGPRGLVWPFTGIQLANSEV